MSWARCRALIASDLWRHAGRLGTGVFLRHFLATPGFRYSTLLRFYSYTVHAPWCQLGVRQLTVLALHRYTIRYGIDISRDASIGSGLYIGHFGGIVVNEAVRIGNNCNLSHGVTLGRLNRGDRMGCPSIGNDVYIGPGAKILGRINVGDRAAIGANAVVVADVPADAVVGGVPARAISEQGSAGYINRTDYPPIPDR
ncbi:MAG: serine acetyltransferase [Proteobacteria bacterium]|nr:serine acetyltransferase [Pseudomonadota bacterium]